MRQLLIIAIETGEALDIDRLALEVPRLIKGARAFGEALTEPFTAKQVAASARSCVERVQTDCNVRVEPERSAGEIVVAGYEQLLAVVDRHDRLIAKQDIFNARVLATLLDPPEGFQFDGEHLADFPSPAKEEAPAE